MDEITGKNPACTGADPEKENDVLLKVEHLCQYFKVGPGQWLKAVDDINFEIKKGEVFGLVGESGCGKTTTGRTIIKLYDATSGNVYFKGVRIAAGILSYKNAIKQKKAEQKAAVSKLVSERDDAIKKISEEKKGTAEDIGEEVLKVKALYAEKMADVKKEAAGFIAEKRAEIKKARYDHKNCDRIYSKRHIGEIKDRYAALLKDEKDGKRKAELLKKYKEETRLAKKDRILSGIQMIFQDPIASLDPRMTVREIIAEGLRIRGEKDQKRIDEQVYRMLDLVGLVAEHASRYPHEFSGGQRQRIGVARAIILNPDLIIADEPVSALDVSIQAQVINLLNDLRKQFGLTLMFIAHDLSVVKYFSDRIGVMYYGKLVEMADSDELFNHPLHPYTKSLLSAIPLPDPNYEKNRRRIIYNPIAEHDYSSDKPVMREILPGHFIYCNNAEFEKYKKTLEKREEQ